jgi:hypothetical protein
VRKALFSVMCVCLWLAAVPASAATLTVNAGGDLQAAINAAQPGDTILLQAGATFNGPFRLPAKGGTTYITIRSNTPDHLLPAAGVRITPAQAPLLAKIRATTAGPAIRVSGAGSNYWRLLFLEFLPNSSNSSSNLVEFGGDGSGQSTLSSVPHHLIMDRCYLHGNASYGQRRGLALNSGETQVINSYFSDFKKVQQDTQAIMGWNGPGPYLIENNHLEAAAENVMFGGTDPRIPNLVPSNITIRRNLITKPLAWRTASWTVKNLLEFKSAQNVLVEGNYIQNNWAAGQQGYAILFTPRNQSGTAPWTVVKNITIQNNVIRHVAGVFNINGYDNLSNSEQTQDIVIRNNLVYDVSTSYGTATHPAPARFAIIGGGPKDITIEHNTIDSNGSSTIFLYRGFSETGTKIYGFALRNNLFRDNTWGIYGDKVGEGNVALNDYTPNVAFLRNGIGGGSGSLYPTGNDFPTMAEWVGGFMNRAGTDYRLTDSSVSNNAGTDGKDLGVDFAALNAALSGSAAPPPPPPPPPAPAPVAGSQPYSGTPVAVPGKVQFENYDRGGSNVGYYDTTSGNSGSVYRTDGVDIQATTDSGGGYTLAWVKAGEWLNFTVNVATAGSYVIDFRVASKGAGGKLHVESGAAKTSAIAVPNTGAWQTWTTVTSSNITLAAGKQILKVRMDTNGPGGAVANLNWFAVRKVG